MTIYVNFLKVYQKKRTPYKNLDLSKIGKHILWLQTLTDISQYPTKDLALNIKANYYKWRNIKSCPKWPQLKILKESICKEVWDFKPVV